jgi:hypothetical protein
VSVVFGFQRKSHRPAIMRTFCAGCHDKRTHELSSVRARFRLTCGECGASTTVSAEKADMLLATAERVDEQTTTGDRISEDPVAV